MMLVLQECQRLVGCAKLLKQYVHSSQAVHAIINHCSCARIHSTTCAYINKHGCNSERNVPKEPLIDAKDASLRFQVINTETNKPPGIATRLLNSSPPKIQPYLKLMRIDKPIGSWLLFWPCGWSIAMAAPAGSLPDLHLLALFGTGAFIMRGAGCTINDMWDQDIDGMIARTKDRPLVTGEISPLQSMIFLGGQLSLGLLVLLQLNWYSVILGTSSLVLVIMYPVMKRVTYWPQLILGMTFNWGALLGWSAVQGSCNWSVCLPLYAAGICWTILYDTIYAHQDKIDDAVVGIKSTALKFGDKTKLYLSGFGTAMITGLITSGILAEQTWPYFVSVGLVGAHVANQIYSLNINNPSDCASKFISNHRVGLILFTGIVLGNLMKNALNEEDKNEKSVSTNVDDSAEVVLLPEISHSSQTSIRNS